MLGRVLAPTLDKMRSLSARLFRRSPLTSCDDGFGVGWKHFYALYLYSSFIHTLYPFDMFGSVSRTLGFLARTPLVPTAPTGPGMVELSNLSGPSRRPRAASRTISGLSLRGNMESRRYASDRGKQELYSDESGSLGAGVSPFPSGEFG